jgi:hypothetical protein
VPNFDYDIEPLATNNDPNYADGTSLTTTQISEIAGLVVYGNTLLADGGDSYGPNQDSAAVQLAIWSVEYSTASSLFAFWDYPSGAAPASLVSQTNALIADAEAGDFVGSAEEMLGVDGQQSYAIAVTTGSGSDVPIGEPGSLALFAAALIVLGLLPRASMRRRIAARPAVVRAI